jgi:hypothetical protein
MGPQIPESWNWTLDIIIKKVELVTVDNLKKTENNHLADSGTPAAVGDR